MIEFNQVVYDFSKAQIRESSRLPNHTRVLCGLPIEWNSLKPPIKSLGLLSKLIRVDQTNNYQQTKNKIIEALSLFGGLFHPYLNRKANPAIFIRGEPSTFKTFFALSEIEIACRLK
jgi:hypothetical protein